MADRYCNVFRHSPSGREEKRLLNRARKCGFCPEPLGADRALFRAYTGFTACELVPAHLSCGEAEPGKIDARRQREEAERLARSARYAAEMRARSRLILVEAGLPSLEIPAGAGALLAAMLGPGGPWRSGPPYTHVHRLPDPDDDEADEDLARLFRPYTITRESE